MMEIVNEIEIVNPIIQETQVILTRQERELEGYLAFVESETTGIEVEGKLLKEMSCRAVTTALNNKAIPESVRKQMREFRTGEKAELKHKVARHKRRKYDYTQAAKNVEKNLERLVVSLAKKKEKYPPQNLHIDAVMEALSTFPNVREGSVTLNNVTGSAELRFVLEDLTCIVNEKPYPNIKDSTWKLPPIAIRMNLSTGQSQVFSEELTVKIPKAYAGRKPHPHIMHGNTPCYGDFLGAVVDAKEDLDISQMVTIIQLFLEQANYRDDAGTHFPKFMAYQAQGFNASRWRSRIDNSTRVTWDGIRFWGYSGEGLLNPNKRVYFIPVIEDGVFEMHEVIQEEGVIQVWMEDLSKSKTERKLAVLPENKPVKKAVRKAVRKKAPEAPRGVAANVPVRDDVLDAVVLMAPPVVTPPRAAPQILDGNITNGVPVAWVEAN